MTPYTHPYAIARERAEHRRVSRRVTRTAERHMDLPLTLHEFVEDEKIPLVEVAREILAFMREQGGHAVLFGAHAVNLYATPSRMTADVDILTVVDAEAMADELRGHLAAKFDIEVLARRVGQGFRVYQVLKTGNRRLAYVRDIVPGVSVRVIDGLHVVDPIDLVASKIISSHARANTPKGLLDRVDLERLLLALPKLRASPKAVSESLVRLGRADLISAWVEVAEHPMELDEEG